MNSRNQLDICMFTCLMCFSESIYLLFNPSQNLILIMSALMLNSLFPLLTSHGRVLQNASDMDSYCLFNDWLFSDWSYILSNRMRKVLQAQSAEEDLSKGCIPTHTLAHVYVYVPWHWAHVFIFGLAFGACCINIFNFVGELKKERKKNCCCCGQRMSCWVTV